MNKYIIGVIAAITALVFAFYYFTNSETWDSSRYILSANSDGNLKPISESYFESSINTSLAKMNTKLAQMNTKLAQTNTKLAQMEKKVNANEKGVKDLWQWTVDHACHAPDRGGCGGAWATHFNGIMVARDNDYGSYAPNPRHRYGVAGRNTSAFHV